LSILHVGKMLQVLVSRILALLNAIGSLVAHDVDKTIKSSIQSVESDQTFCAAPKSHARTSARNWGHLNARNITVLIRQR
jgi:hypothetical protein